MLTGSALGGMLRYAMSEWLAALLQEQFPWSTWAVNLSGAFLLGLLLPGLMAGAPPAMQVVAVYVLGSYTTVSAFALQGVLLVDEGRERAALGYVLGSATTCLLAAGSGALLAGGLAG